MSISSATGARTALTAGNAPAVACYAVTFLSLTLSLTEERGHDGMGKILPLIHHSVPLVLSASAPAETGLRHLTKHKVFDIAHLSVLPTVFSFKHPYLPGRDS